MWSAPETRHELMSVMNSLGIYKGSSIVMGIARYKPHGWPNSIKWENWKANMAKKDQSRVIIKSILEYHGITDLENFCTSSQGEAACPKFSNISSALFSYK